MKKIIAWLLVLALTAAVSIGATLAYLTDTDEDVNVMTIGKVKIDQLEYERIDDESKNEDAQVQEFHDNKPLYPAVTEKGFDYTPGDPYVDWEQIGKDGYTSDIWDPTKINNEVDKMVFIKNKGDYDAYVRSVFAFEAGQYTTLDEFKSMVHLNLNESDYTWQWVQTPVAIPNEEGTTTNYFVAVATYNEKLAPGALTEISLSQIALDSSATNEDVEAFGETYQVLVKSQGIQADGFESPVLALEEGFGAIDETNIPWKNDISIQGISIPQALQYLNGDATGEAITTQINSITFGLNRNYPDIVASYDGVLVDVEQDVPVYAYYTPAGTAKARAVGYDLFFLADDVIYSPVESNKLFNGMSALTSLNTENLDTSRTTTMRAMFQNCSSLKSVDVSKWDTSKVTDITGMFNKCTALESVEGTENWDMSACTAMYLTFQNCNSLKSLNVTGWDTSDVTTMEGLFKGCSALTGVIGIGSWNTGNVTTMCNMFYNCQSLTQLADTGDWDTGNVTNMGWMFYNCKNLKTIGATNWDTSSLDSLLGTFNGCEKLELLDVSKWDTSSMTDPGAAFQNCKALKSLDVSGWDVSKVYRTTQMFNGCEALVDLPVGNWNFESLKETTTMLQGCKSLVELDVSKWNMSNVTRVSGMFNHCEKLQKLDVTNWDVSKVSGFDLMFQQCWALNELDISKWDTSSATHMGWMFYGCRSLPVLDVSNLNVSKVTVMSHMFADCNSVAVLDVTNWNLNSLMSVDALFNDCSSIRVFDVSKWNTSNIKEFSQMFEGCRSLEYIIGLENWDTSNARTFDETFNNCISLKELNLSSFDTRNVTPGFKNQNGDKCKGFSSMFAGVSSLEKLVIGENFAFAGNGSVAAENQTKLPAPKNAEGLWYDEAGNAFAASEIPEKTAAAYYAVKPVNS